MMVLKRLGLLLVLLLILLLAVLAYATMTHGGMKRLFSLGQSYTQGELSWGESTGKLVGPATLNNVVYSDEAGTSVEISNARFDWKPGALIKRTLQVDEFELSGVTVRLPPPSTEPAPESAPFQLRDLALPLAADINNVKIEDLKIYPHGVADPFVIDSITLSAGGQNDELTLVELAVAAPQGELRMDGAVSTSGDWPLNLSQRWRVDHPQFGEFNGSGSMMGNIKSLRLQHKVDGAVDVMIDTRVKDVTAELSWDGEVAVQSDDLGVFSKAAEGVPLSLDVLTSGSLMQYKAQGKLNTNYIQTGPLDAEFDLTGTLEEMSIASATINPLQSTAVAETTGTLRFSDLYSDLRVQWTDVPWPLTNITDGVDGDESRLLNNAVVVSPQGTLNFTGTPDEFDVTINTAVEQDAAGELDIDLLIEGSPKLINIDSLTVESSQGNTNLDVSGSVDLERRVVDLNGQWDDLIWPLTRAENTQQVFESEAGKFSVQGPLDNYKVVAELSVDGENVPPGDWQLTANGNTESLADIDLQAKTLDGVIAASGNVQWSPVAEWMFDVQANDINPALKWAGMDGDIGLKMQSSGALNDKGSSIDLKLLEITGDYRNQALSGSGEIDIIDGDVSVNDMNLRAGIASIDASGLVGKTLRLDWMLNAPALEKILPGMQGGIDVKGRLKGSAEQPASDFTIDLEDYTSGDIRIKSIKGGGSIDLSGKAQSTIKIKVTDLSAAGQVWDQLQLNGRGTPADHQMDITLDGELANVKTRATGSMSDASWRGRLEQIDILQTPLGDWTLAKPVAIDANAQRVEAEPLCIVSEPSSVCINGDWNAASGGGADVEVVELDGRKFSDFMPPDLELDARLSGTARARVDAAGKPELIADFTVPGGVVNYLDTGVPTSDKLGESRIRLALLDDNVTTKIDLDLGPIGTANVDTKIVGLSTTKKLSGTVKTDIEDMALVSTFAPDLQAMDGKFDTDMTLGGTLDEPQVVGETGLNGLVTEIPAIAMKVLDGTMKAESDGKGGLVISGTATSGDGRLDINGLVNPSTGDLDLVIKGEEFEVANTARQRAVVSPDLQVQISGQNIKVTGEVHIPSAYIQAGGEDALVNESSDVVIVNSDNPNDDQAESLVELDVKVTLGDDIRVNAGPFNGALSGGITVQQQPGRVPTGSGAIEVVSGDFLVYGQKLTMERGRILFGGGPIDNPALDLDVAREVVGYDIKAGARISGTAQAPLLQLQSDPSQTDANTLSYILFGKPVGTVGVSYTLGKFITPDLYVSYGVDLFDKLQTFNLRYKISNKLALIGASNKETSGADLIYTIER